MNKPLLALAASAMALTVYAAPVQAQDAPRVFERDGPWALEAGEDFCQLARSFTDGESSVALALERNRLGNTLRLILVSDAITTYRNTDQIGYAYLPANDQRSAMFVKSETPDGEAYFNLGTVAIGENLFAGFGPGGPGGPRGSNAPPDGPPPGMVAGREEGAFVPASYDREKELEFAAGITALAFNEGLLRAIRLETGSLRGPVQALQACTDDLVRSWGLDWEAHQTMTAAPEPIGPAWEWIPRGTVPFQEFGAFGGARNPFRVMVDAQGNPTGCHVHWPSLDASTNETICEGIMENGRFHPALDANGEPMASYWMADYRFTLNRPFGR